jgi:hypothetical protein
MAYDLLLKTTTKNWARGAEDTSYKPYLTTSKSPKVTPTRREVAMLAGVSRLRQRAAAGDAKASSDLKKLHAKVVALRVRAKGGDPEASRTCQLLEQSGVLGPSRDKGTASLKPSNSKASGDLVGRQEIMGSEIFGEFVGDEERLSREAGPSELSASARLSGSSPPSWIRRLTRSKGRKSRSRRLRKLAWRASRGDSSATAKLQAVTDRLRQRASAGDARASAVLQEIQAVQARAQASAQQNSTATPYAPPPAASPPTSNVPVEVTYTAPAAYADDEAEY